MSNYLDNFSLLSPEEPSLFEVSTGTFGTSDSPVDFSYGGTSDLPDGSINPEDFAAFPKELFEEGIIKPGQPMTVINPTTKKKVVVIARHGKEGDSKTGMDLAPHSILELGTNPQSKYILDTRPVAGYPAASYPVTPPESDMSAPAKEVGQSIRSGLSDVSLDGDGGSPGASRVEPDSGSSEVKPDGIKTRNEDGSVTYNDGITIFPDGHFEHPVAGGKKTAVWVPGSNKPTYVDNKLAGDKERTDEDTDETIANAIINGTQPPDLKGLYRHGAGIRKHLQKQGYDLAAANLDWQAAQKHIASLEGPQQLRMRQAIDNAFHSLDVIEDLSKQWDAGGFPLVNKARLLLAKQGALGPDAQKIATQLEAQISDVTSELGNVYMGGNSPTDHSLKLAQSNLSASWSKETLAAALNLARKNLVIRDNSIKNAGVSLRGNRYAPDQGGQSMTPGATPSPSPGKTPASSTDELEAAARRVLIKDPNNEKAKEVLRQLGK